MGVKFEVKDNFLEKEEFKKMQELVRYELPFYYKRGVSRDLKPTEKSDDGYHFAHYFYFNDEIQSVSFGKVINPLLKKIKSFSLLRAKANLYPCTPKIMKHGWHKDFPFPHKGFLFYINTNNGFTVLKDGTKIESVENRALFFDAGEKHHSTTCTDDDVRLNININYV
tara:strand:- start:95 stop:598 length:504 start_codon:yes stop_codon:yes gene_type:complete